VKECVWGEEYDESDTVVADKGLHPPNQRDMSGKIEVEDARVVQHAVAGERFRLIQGC